MSELENNQAPAAQPDIPRPADAAPNEPASAPVAAANLTSLVTPVGGATITLRPYTPAKVDLANRAVFLRYASFDTKAMASKAQQAKRDGTEITDADAEGVSKFENIPGEAFIEMNKNTVMYMVTAINGNSYNNNPDRILEVILDMHGADYEAIVQRCNEIDTATRIDSKKA